MDSQGCIEKFLAHSGRRLEEYQIHFVIQENMGLHLIANLGKRMKKLIQNFSGKNLMLSNTMFSQYVVFNSWWKVHCLGW